MILIFIGIANTSGGPSLKEQCEAQGGKYVQTMKSYHTCKMPKTVL